MHRNVSQDGANNDVDIFFDGKSIVDDLKQVTESLDDLSSLFEEQQEKLDEIASAVEEQAETIEENQKAIGDLSDLFGDFESDFDDELRLKTNSGHSKSKMKIVGRVHVDYWGFPESSPGIDALEGGPAGPQDRFGFRRMRFGVRGNLPSNMDYRIEMEFAGGNRSEFRDAWLGFKDIPRFGKILIGNQKRPYGLDHLNSSRYNVFLERPFVIESLQLVGEYQMID